MLLLQDCTTFSMYHSCLRMASPGVLSFYGPGPFLFCRHDSFLSILSSAKIHHDRNLKMAFGVSCQAFFSYYKRTIKCASSRGNHYPRLSTDDGSDQKPVWLDMIQDIAQSLRSLALFLLEQPSQLKYIEWPSFESTAKTATLTLILVALLIVSLSSVDSLLIYILALLRIKSA